MKKDSDEVENVGKVTGFVALLFFFETQNCLPSYYRGCSANVDNVLIIEARVRN